MPWHYEPMKDATNSEMLRVAVSTQRSVDIRMGKPTSMKSQYRIMNKQLYEGRPGELKHLSNQRKRKQQRFPEQRRLKGEQPDTIQVTKLYHSRMVLEKPNKEGEIPVYEMMQTQVSKSRAEHVEFCLKMRGPSRKAKYYIVTDSEPVL